jgi:Gram-negative bacterial TonB protein C-terminal
MKYRQPFGKTSLVIGIVVLLSATASLAQTPVDPQSATLSAADAASKNSCASQTQPPKLSYPKRARAMGITGVVVVQVRIDAEGVPQDVKVIERRLNKTSVTLPDGTAEDVTYIFDATATGFAQSLSCSKRAGKQGPRGVVIQVPLNFDLTN